MSASQLRLRRLRRDAVLQAPDEIEVVVAAILTIRRIQPERQPDLGAVVHHVGAGRHDADDLAAPAIDLDTVCPTIGRPPNAVCHNSCERIAMAGGGAARAVPAPAAGR